MITKVNAKYIVAFNGENHVILRDGVIVYENNEIKHVGKNFSDHVDSVIDASDQLVIPGLINLHSHITQSPLQKALKEDLPRDVSVPGPGTLDEKKWETLPDEPETLAKCSLFELLKSGVTTIVELGAPDWMGYKEAVDFLGYIGIRTYLSAGYRSGSWIKGEPTHDIDKGLKQMENALKYVKQLDGSYNDRINFILYPRTVDLCLPEIFQKTKLVADELNLPIQTHASQSIREYHYIKKTYGITPIEFLEKQGILGNNLILGHCIFVSNHKLINENQNAPELDLISKSNSTVVHCPWIYSKVGISLESYSQYLKKGIRIGFGTDVAPQNMLREINLASIITKIVDVDSTSGKAKDIFNSATLTGANALGRNDLGRIIAGAKADLVFINLDSLNMTPLKDPIKNLIYYASNSDVETVIIDGNVVVENSNVIGMDEISLSKSLQKIGDNYYKSIPWRDTRGRTFDEISPMTFPKWKE